MRLNDSEKRLQADLSKLEDEQYAVEKLKNYVLAEEEQNEEETYRLLHLINESQQDWISDKHFSQRLENQDYRLRNIQGQRKLFMEEWIDEIAQHKKKLIHKEEELRTQLRKDQQKMEEY